MHLCADTVDILMVCIDTLNEVDDTPSLRIVGVKVVIVDVEPEGTDLGQAVVVMKDYLHGVGIRSTSRSEGYRDEWLEAL